MHLDAIAVLNSQTPTQGHGLNVTWFTDSKSGIATRWSAPLVRNTEPTGRGPARDCEDTSFDNDGSKHRSELGSGSRYACSIPSYSSGGRRTFPTRHPLLPDTYAKLSDASGILPGASGMLPETGCGPHRDNFHSVEGRTSQILVENPHPA